MLVGALVVQGLFDAGRVVPGNIFMGFANYLAAGERVPVFGIDGLGLHAAEEALHGAVVRTAALGAHRTPETGLLHQADPSGPPVVAPAVRVHDGPEAI